MKKIITMLLSISVCILLAGSLFVSYVHAEKEIVTNVYLPKDKVINHDYFAAGDTVNLSGTINGDAYIAGGNVTVDGNINGDLLAAGGNVTILGKVAGNVRTVGGNIIFSSDVSKNATIIGGSISMTESGNITGSLVSAGGNISINSPIGKEINVAAGHLSLGSKIGSNVNAYTDDINLDPETQISGDLNYWSQKKAQFNPEASISGQTYYHYVQTPKHNEKKVETDTGRILGLVTMGGLMFNIYSLTVSFIIGLLLIRLLPVFTKGTVDNLATSPWASLGIGILTLVLFPITFITLLITIIGIPLAMILLMALIILWFISEIFVALYIGTKLLVILGMEKHSQGWALFTGLIFLGILALIPVINFLVGMLTYLFGMGALLIQKKNSYKLLRQKQLI